MADSTTENAICDAAAMGELVVVTGAGISTDLRTASNARLPTWGQLLQSLESGNRDRSNSQREELLRRLLPQHYVSSVHGNALIEAAELLSEAYPKGEFEQKVADLCAEAPRTTTKTHKAIEKLNPAGVITFNYDQAHETAFEDRANVILYSDDNSLRGAISRKLDDPPFLLKAHGCISEPQSLVLTGSSYRAVMARHRAYRAFLQHTLAQYTILIVGFALRDRDFDQMLLTMEVEFGSAIRPHGVITKKTVADLGKDAALEDARWASLDARYKLSPIYVDGYDQIPSRIESFGTRPGPIIQKTVDELQSCDASIRTIAHERMRKLSPVGKRQMLGAIEVALNKDPSYQVRSELLYGVGEISSKDTKVFDFLINEINKDVHSFFNERTERKTECIAHGLRSIRSQIAVNAEVIEDAFRPILSRAHDIDEWLRQSNMTPRIEAYARAASFEVLERTRHYNVM